MDRHETDLADGCRPSCAPPRGTPRRLPRPVRAVVFDLDGTLLDTELFYRAAFFAAMDELGWSLPEADYDGLIGLPNTARRRLLPQMLGPAFPVSVFFEAYYRHRSAALARGVPLKPGVTDALACLDAAKLVYAVATSASARTAHANLALAGLPHRFPIVVTRDDVPRGKPCPDSFLEAASRLGAAPQDCVAVEDSSVGVLAACRAGMMVVTIPDALPPSPALLGCCVAVLGSLHELGTLLALPAAEPARDNRSPLRV